MRVQLRTKEHYSFRNLEPGAFYEKLEKALNKVNTSFRFHISLGYVLISDMDGHDEVGWYPSDNTRVSDEKFRVYRKCDTTNIVNEALLFGTIFAALAHR